MSSLFCTFSQLFQLMLSFSMLDILRLFLCNATDSTLITNKRPRVYFYARNRKILPTQQSACSHGTITKSTHSGGGVLMKRTNNQQTNWPGLIKNYQESGLSAAAWCRENNLKPHQLYYQLDKANGKKQAETKWLALDEPEVSTIKIK